MLSSRLCRASSTADFCDFCTGKLLRPRSKPRAGTPIIDAASRSLYVAGMSTPDGGATTRHLIWRVSALTGTVYKGWPVDVAAGDFPSRIVSFFEDVEECPRWLETHLRRQRADTHQVQGLARQRGSR